MILLARVIILLETVGVIVKIEGVGDKYLASWS